MSEEKITQSSDEELLSRIKDVLLREDYPLTEEERNKLKNESQIPFGILYPAAYCSVNEFLFSSMQTDCFVRADEGARLNVNLKFLQFIRSPFENLQAIERIFPAEDLSIARLVREKKVLTFQYYAPDLSGFEEYLLLEARFSVHATALAGIKNIFQVTTRVDNISKIRKRLLKNNASVIHYAFVSTHILMQSRDLDFIPSQTPPVQWSEALHESKEQTA